MILVVTVTKELFRLVISWPWLTTLLVVLSTLVDRSSRAVADAFVCTLASKLSKLFFNSVTSPLTEEMFPPILLTVLLKSFKAELSALRSKSCLLMSKSAFRSVIRLLWLVSSSSCWVVLDSKALIAEELDDTLGSLITSQ